MISQVIPFLTASVILTVSPGPDIIYVLVQSIANGRKAGLVTTLGLVSGILVHTSLVAFGVSAIIKESDDLFMIIKIVGALYLFYLAYKVIKSGHSISITSSVAPEKNIGHLYKRGFIMNVINPKVTIFFLAFFPGFLWEPEANTISQFFILGFLFMLQAFLIFGFVAILAGKISIYLSRHKTSGIILKWLQVLAFIGIGIFILL